MSPHPPETPLERAVLELLKDATIEEITSVREVLQWETMQRFDSLPRFPKHDKLKSRG